MIRTTPFHPRLRELNTQGLYTHWQGCLSPLRYSSAPKHEYFAVRNAVGVFDTSPLFKYRITGPDAERLLAGALVRDIRRCHPGSLRVHLEDVSDEYGILAVQGPRSRAALSSLMPEVSSLAFFEHAQAKLASGPVTVSRTGYTGDLGFEITVESDHALAALDAVLEVGAPHGMRPFGEEALMMLRIEAGLPLIDVEWHNSRTAFTDADRVTPK